MGSDGFESKKLGGPPSGGSGSDRLGPSEYAGSAGRDPAIDALTGLGESAANLVEISRVIKWFDASKGYGFIVPDNGAADVLLHVTVLRRDGYQTAYEGARVHALVQRGPKGLQALQVLSMDESTAIHPSHLPQRTKEKVQPESDWVRVVVRWYNRPKGYGFATRGEGTPDLFVHAETLRRWGFAPLWPGQVVEVRWGMGSKGCMVAEIRSPESMGLSATN